MWDGEPNAISNGIGYAKFRSRSRDAVIRVYDAAGNMIENARARRRFGIDRVKFEHVVYRF